MAIKLWQRKHGHLGPPDELIHAEPESRHFPVPFRNRIVRWSVDCFRQRFPPAPYADDSPEEIRGALNSLCHQLAEAYGRPLPVQNAKRFPADFMFQLTRVETEAGA